MKQLGDVSSPNKFVQRKSSVNEKFVLKIKEMALHIHLLCDGNMLS